MPSTSSYPEPLGRAGLSNVINLPRKDLDKLDLTGSKSPSLDPTMPRVRRSTAPRARNELKLALGYHIYI
ncbi:hypothetical protein TNCV_904151 [Trichonephila clavipes]|nr:hypothetical protein TNCV_904151 [Trichonephila clavipes]